MEKFPEMNATPERAGRLASLLMLSYEPMFAWNLDGAIEFWNAGAERLYGFASTEAASLAAVCAENAFLPDAFSIVSTTVFSKPCPGTATVGEPAEDDAVRLYLPSSVDAFSVRANAALTSTGTT
jgi:hypothetical protein